MLSSRPVETKMNDGRLFLGATTAAGLQLNSNVCGIIYCMEQRPAKSIFYGVISMPDAKSHEYQPESPSQR